MASFDSSSENISTQHLDEALSALMDGEASELELRRVLKSSDAALRQRWHRYQLVGAAMRNEVVADKTVDLSPAIAAAIANEPPLNVRPNQKAKNLWSVIGRFGVAATVAGAVVIGVQFAPGIGTFQQVAELPSISAPTNGTVMLGNDTTVRTVSQQFNDQSRDKEQQRQPLVISEATQAQIQQTKQHVNRLMLEHAQNATQNTQQGILPYVRVPDAEQ